MVSAVVKTETKPVWNSSSFLVYTGGLTVLFGAIAGLSYLAISRSISTSYYPLYHPTSHGEMVAWALLFLVILYGIANALRYMGRWLAAGVFAFVSVLVWAYFLVTLFRWFGWSVHDSMEPPTRQLHDWSWPRMLGWVLVLVFASFNRWRFKFPFIRLISAVVFWLFMADLLTTGRGDSMALVTFLVGLLYLLVGSVVDKPSAFWLHLVGGALIGGVFFHWFHTSDGDFAAISILSLAYVFIAYWTKRSSWAVYGTIGFFLAAGHYVTGTPRGLLPYQLLNVYYPSHYPSAPWAPAVAYGSLGFFLVALGMLGKWKKGRTHAAVVTTPAPPPATEPLAE